MNPLATGALVALAIAQLIIAGILWDPDPQEIHFGAIAKYCQELPNVRAQGPEGYFQCVARFASR